MTNGITGCASATVSRRTCSSVADERRAILVGAAAPPPRGQPRLDELQVPVAQLAVDEVVQPERGVREVVVLDPRGGVGRQSLEPREDPAVLDACAAPGQACRAPRRAAARRLRQREARRVEELVRERLPLLDLLGGVAHVLRGGHREQAEPHRVGPVAVDQSSGSMPVPRLLLIRRPSGSLDTELM